MITIPDYNTIFGQVLAFFRNRFPGKDTHSESFLGKTARALARTIQYLLYSLQSVDQDAVPNQKTSYAALTNMASAYGVPSNLGNFGPNGPVAATGGVVSLTGTNGTAYTSGLLLTGPDGVTLFQLSANATIPGNPPGSGSVSCNVIAVTAGSAGNLAAGQALTFQQPPSGADQTVYLTTGTAGGLDSETQQSLLQRIFNRWQLPPKGGAAQDYRTWAESVSGVSRAYVYPKRSGTGTVDVVITSASTGLGRDPGATVATNAANYINGNASANPPIVGVRPVTATGINVRRPYMTQALAIRARIVVSAPKYAFDWALGASAFTVASYNAGTGVLTMNQAIPVSLQNAIAAYLANPTTVAPPRLQVIATGMPSPGIATPVNVISTSGMTLTLATPVPAAWTPPTAGDSVYPYGPAVPIVAAGAVAGKVLGVQGYVDTLGPSRASGYANTLDVWQDTASYLGIAQAALDVTDADGVTKPVSRVLSSTINGASADVQATDTPSGIGLLYCGSIAITD